MLGLDVVVKKVFGSRADRLVKKKRGVVSRINELEPKYQALSDEQLRGCTADFRQRLENGAPLDDLLPEAFAVTREAGKRALSMRHFDTQLIGGMVLHDGMVAEMRTGEGKTLVATAPVYLNALSGKGVHVVTVNDYLAQRDADWMGRIYRFLGLSVGVILSNERNDGVKRAAYGADITYGTNNEFGFDYLRDNMKMSLEEYVQRGHNYAIVDEVDSILIDEARTPLIISGPTNLDINSYQLIDSIIPILQKEIDFTVDEKQRRVALTDGGTDKVESRLGIDNLYDPHNMEILHHVNQALRAHFLYKRDKDYVVQNGKVVIVDEHTGRLMVGRRWSDGLHQAIEAKERVKVEAESQTYATITFQNYFRMYGKLAGMTGTAETEAEEFGKIYNLEVIPIPTNRPVARLDHHDIVYKTQGEKFTKVLQELEECYAKGQPVLVGTTSVENSERVARLLEKRGIPHNVLNAKAHAREAEVVAQAGRLRAVTISTNMAGRGTDIKLGGDPEGLARTEILDGLSRALLDLLGEPPFNPQDVGREPFERVRSAIAPLGPLVSETTPEELWRATLDRVARGVANLYGPNLGGFDLSPVLDAVPEKARTAVVRWRASCEAEREEVMKAGGLHILGTERHESRRIDNQLRGRSGRQGDPGSSRFYLSLEDDLLRLFGSDRIIVWMERMGLKDDEPIEHRWITSSIENAQKKVEGQNFNIRKNLLEYDDVMNLQRKAVYDLRKRALTGENVRQMMTESIEALVVDLLDEYVPAGTKPEVWNAPGLLKRIEEVFTVRWEDTPEHIKEMSRQEIIDRLRKDAIGAYEAKEQEFGTPDGEGQNPMRQLERLLLLQFTDSYWKDHLLAMDRLRDGIGLRGYGQRNPLLEYKKEAFNMFMLMTSLRDEAVISRLLRMQMRIADEVGEASPKAAARRLATADLSEPAIPANGGGAAPPPPPLEPIQFAAPPARSLPAKGIEARLFAAENGVRRNDPCPCGSGLKFKKCCYEEGGGATADA